MIKVGVLGITGQVGKALKSASNYFPFIEIVPITTRLDTSWESIYLDVAAHIHEHHLDFVVNCAAMVGISDCETNPQNAYQINTIAVDAIIKACESTGLVERYIQLSSDYCNKPRQSYYAKTKYLAEGLTRMSDLGIIIRTSAVFGDDLNNKNSFVSKIYKKLIDCRDHKLDVVKVTDQACSPTYAGDLAFFILNILASPTLPEDTLLEVGGNNTTFYDLAVYIQTVCLGGSEDCVEKIAHIDLQRPKYTSFPEKGKLGNWQQSVAKVVAGYRGQE